ncbi:MAG: acetate--CoA ligase [Bacteroidota bacterium]|jgi:acetyl-CoA synthetase
MSDYPYQINSLEDYYKIYKRSIDHPTEFWSEIASHFTWQRKWDNILNWNFEEPAIAWFKGAKLNITENCIDRHLTNDAEKTAIIWEANDPKESNRIISYKELHIQVSLFSNVLKKNGVTKGDRVCIYMGMVPELAIAVLACARIGAIHSVIFGGFSAQSIADRLEDAKSEFIITCDGAYRGSKSIGLKNIIDEALQSIDFVKKVIVHKRTYEIVNMFSPRDVWWDDEIAYVEAYGLTECKPEIMDAEDPLFILYTSGSTGKPKGVVHSCAGYMIWTNYTFVNVFQYQKNWVHFCTADIGWITGHSYIIYGPLSAGGTSLMFEGIPTYPDAGRFWDLVEKYKVNILYTAPTAIRSLMTFGTDVFKGKNLDSLKVIGTVGEPINEEAWHWYDEHVGKHKCPIVDTWWQTETGGIMISNLAGITPAKASWATLPLPGVQPLLVDEKGNEVTEKDENEILKGNLCIQAPWPAIIRTTYGDHQRCKSNYFSTYEGLYFTGDGALKDKSGNYRITGRVDDVLNVSGHRIGTAEIENAINACVYVFESAVVGYPHDIKGQGIYAFVIIDTSHNSDESMVKKMILEEVTKIIGAIAKPDKIQVVSALPKTRSGKIMRRILRKIAEGELSNLGDTTTLLDPNVVEEIKLGRL